MSRTDEVDADRADLADRDMIDAERTAEAASDRAHLTERDLHARVADLTRALAEQSDDVANLRRAMETRGVIERAKGFLMGTLGCSEDEAFAHLVAHSQRTNMKLYVIAGLVVAAPKGRTPRK
ncbi:MAG: two-component system response regulator [Acidimicrobiales bacterium]|nr:two-component system response regulator [Acidimicrobiales bacterium]